MAWVACPWSHEWGPSYKTQRTEDGERGQYRAGKVIHVHMSTKGGAKVAAFQKSSLRRCRDGSSQCRVCQSSLKPLGDTWCCHPGSRPLVLTVLFDLPPCCGPPVPSCSPFQLWLQQPPHCSLDILQVFHTLSPTWVPTVSNVATQHLC